MVNEDILSSTDGWVYLFPLSAYFGAPFGDEEGPQIPPLPSHAVNLVDLDLSFGHNYSNADPSRV